MEIQTGLLQIETEVNLVGLHYRGSSCGWL